MRLSHLLGLMVLILIVLCMASYHQIKRNALPSHIKTLAQFNQEMPQPREVSVFRKGSQRYIQIKGAEAGFPAVESGPAFYIFDVHGQIVDWTEDDGDDVRGFNHRWESATGFQIVSMAQALTICNATPQPRALAGPTRLPNILSKTDSN